MPLKIAIQKSGRLYDESISLLNDCGLKVDNLKDQLKAKVRRFDAEILFLRNSDIPKYLEDGVADLAIIGENTLLEKEANVETLLNLGFSKCRLSIAFPKEFNYKGPESLAGKRIATSYPNTLTSFLKKHGIVADIHQISGSVEIAPNIGLADAVCDLVSSGSTLFQNGLEECEVVLRSQACLAANRKSIIEKSALITELTSRIKSVLKARKNRYILFNIPNEKVEEASTILPVLKSPTVLPLIEEGWSSLHSVINEDDFWEVINQLKACGAQGILVIPIEKMVI
ncbi:MAG TPA: ATP phosphoribosyltransferase [Saprospiraceae bacterium]|nr:ATP phosphoribosyltransferase [Saprospiraceae bacterium]